MIFRLVMLVFGSIIYCSPVHNCCMLVSGFLFFHSKSMFRVYFWRRNAFRYRIFKKHPDSSGLSKMSSCLQSDWSMRVSNEDLDLHTCKLNITCTSFLVPGSEAKRPCLTICASGHPFRCRCLLSKGKLLDRRSSSLEMIAIRRFRGSGIKMTCTILLIIMCKSCQKGCTLVTQNLIVCVCVCVYSCVMLRLCTVCKDCGLYFRNLFDLVCL